MHKLLARQLRRQFGSETAAPPELGQFIAAVDAAYNQSDDDRALLERSMENVSVEMIDRYRRLTDALAESQRARDDMHAALALVEATLEATTDGLLVVDSAGEMIRMNRKFIELMRLPEEIIAERDDAKALAYVSDQLEDSESFNQKVAELYASPEAESFDLVRFKDRRVYERYSKPQRVGGVTVGRVWSFRDITARLHLEEQLRQSQKMEAVGSLAGGVAHDFNNLLTVISGHAQFLEEDPDLSPSSRDDLNEILEAGRRAAALTRQLLAFSRRQILQPAVLDVNVVIRGVQPMLLRLIGEDIEVRVELEAELQSVLADQGQLEQVLMNLCVNARDAMPRGGRLTIATHGSDPFENAQWPQHVPPGDYVQLSVADTGTGIPEELRSRIFEPFFTTKEPGKGTGLGLATVYGIVTQSGGYIAVDTQVDRGTTFTVYLPVADTKDEAATVNQDAPVARCGSETILVVEDEWAVRRFVTRALRQQGYAVLDASSGREALAIVAAARGPIDLIVSDVVMPEMSGPELVERLRVASCDLPVVFMSGYTDDEFLRRGIPQSEMKFLQKPFTTVHLVNAVRETLAAAAEREEFLAR